MADLVFDCIGATADRYAVTPSLTFQLQITETTGERIDAIALRCQIRIEPQLRRYSTKEADALRDLFGDPDRWADKLKPLQVANLSTLVGGFSGSTTHDLPLPFSYDLEIASTKYFAALTDGVIPLLMLYSGTVFGTEAGRMRVQQVPWSKETSYPLPVSVFREAVDQHFPNRAWLPVERETLEVLQRFKTRHALPTWDSTIKAVLAGAEQGCDTET